MKFQHPLKNKCSVAGISFAVMLGVTACNEQVQPPTTASSSAASTPASSVINVTKAEAQLQPTKGNNAKGTVTFSDVPGGLRVVVELTGLTPGEHGFHIHEKGDCSAQDASSAAGHFNPTGMPHGSPDAEKHHAGDLGNITADATGAVHLDKIFNFLTLNGPTSIVGLSVIVHQDKDDFMTQPSGNSGARVACGVIQKQ